MEMDINICIPVNIRMSHYATEEHIKLENKFTVFPLNFNKNPTLSDVTQNTGKIHKSFSFGIAFYIFSYISMRFLPFDVARYFANKSSESYTAVVSNVAGPRRKSENNHITMSDQTISETFSESSSTSEAGQFIN
jgi:hypothetical protein